LIHEKPNKNHSKETQDAYEHMLPEPIVGSYVDAEPKEDNLPLQAHASYHELRHYAEPTKSSVVNGVILKTKQHLLNSFSKKPLKTGLTSRVNLNFPGMPALVYQMIFGLGKLISLIWLVSIFYI
jgi:hypothetical protein